MDGASFTRARIRELPNCANIKEARRLMGAKEGSSHYRFSKALKRMIRIRTRSERQRIKRILKTDLIGRVYEELSSVSLGDKLKFATAQEEDVLVYSDGGSVQIF
jgi:hypothetical protein